MSKQNSLTSKEEELDEIESIKFFELSEFIGETGENSINDYICFDLTSFNELFEFCCLRLTKKWRRRRVLHSKEKILIFPSSRITSKKLVTYLKISPTHVAEIIPTIIKSCKASFAHHLLNNSLTEFENYLCTEGYSGS